MTGDLLAHCIDLTEAEKACPCCRKTRIRIGADVPIAVLGGGVRLKGILNRVVYAGHN